MSGLHAIMYAQLKAFLESLSTDGVKRISEMAGAAYTVEWNSGVLLTVHAYPVTTVAATVTNENIYNKYMDGCDRHKTISFYFDEDMDASTIHVTEPVHLMLVANEMDILNKIRQET